MAPLATEKVVVSDKGQSLSNSTARMVRRIPDRVRIPAPIARFISDDGDLTCFTSGERLVRADKDRLNDVYCYRFSSGSLHSAWYASWNSSGQS